MSFGVYLGDETEQSYIEFGALWWNETNQTEPIWTKVLSSQYWAAKIQSFSVGTN